MAHTPEAAAQAVATIRRHMEAAGRVDVPFECTVGGPCESEEDMAAWEAAGIDRLIVSPWQRSRDALEGMETFAERFGLST